MEVIRVLLITPYSPLCSHDHAANDLAAGLVGELSKLVDLHVYAPGQAFPNHGSREIGGVTYHGGSIVQCSQRRRIGSYPDSYRGSWSPRCTREVQSLVEELQPEIVHGEYAQTAEALFRLPVPWSVTLHDMPVKTHSQSISHSRGLRRLYQRLEGWRIRLVERRVIARASCIFVLSERDASEIGGIAHRTVAVQVGISNPSTSWSRERGEIAPILLFAGAMWRTANQTTATYLAMEVLPLVQKQFPDAVLRIVGAHPSNELMRLADRLGVVVTGAVDDFDIEFSMASVVLAPSLVDAGVLLKALRAMACGCPVVMNSKTAIPLAHLEDNVHALVRDDPAEIAEAIASLIGDADLARSVGRRAAEYVSSNYRWDQCAQVYVDAFESILRAHSATVEGNRP